MKKNLIIVFLSITTVASLTFAFLQKQKVAEYEARAHENERMAEEQIMRAQAAEVAVRKARELQQLHTEQLQKAADSMQHPRSAAEAKLVKSRTK